MVRVSVAIQPLKCSILHLWCSLLPAIDDFCSKLLMRIIASCKLGTNTPEEWNPSLQTAPLLVVPAAATTTTGVSARTPLVSSL